MNAIEVIKKHYKIEIPIEEDNIFLIFSDDVVRHLICSAANFINDIRVIVVDIPICVHFIDRVTNTMIHE